MHIELIRPSPRHLPNAEPSVHVVFMIAKRVKEHTALSAKAQKSAHRLRK